MQRIADVLELLSKQHRDIRRLLERLRTGVEGRSEIVDELVDYITAHLAVEQELFYPRVKTLISDEVQRELAAEHAEIRRVLGNLIWQDTDDDQFAITLADLELLLEGHCAWQDEELFETVSETLARAERVDLDGLGDAVRATFASMCAYAHA
jgi:hypothetical protein